MTFIKNKFNHGNEILFAALMVLVFAPHDYRLPGLGILCFFLITAAIIDSKKNKSASDALPGSRPAAARQTHRQVSRAAA
jgi:hypothetical protein